MPYLSRHYVRVSLLAGQSSLDEHKIIQELRKEYRGARYGLDDMRRDCPKPVKWYNALKELKEFSKKYPKQLFRLIRDGEGLSDIWISYVKDGKSYFERVELVYPEFDINKLE